jgi:hypothetical protein
MSLLGIPITNGGSIRQFQFPAMVAGATASTAVSNGYYQGYSQLLGFARTTSGGAVGLPAIGTITGLSSGDIVPNITIVSSSATDTSVYTMYWINPTSVVAGGVPLLP